MKKIGILLFAVVALIGLTSATTNYFEITKYLELFAGVYKNLNTYYVDEIDPEEIVTKGIDAMLEDLDPYSDFIPSEEIEQFEFQSTGEYGGIGATITKSGDYVSVITPYEGSPADKAGLQSGDKFLSIEGQSMKGKSSQEVVKMLKGEPNTDVKVTIGRGDTQFDRTLTREVIKVKNVYFSGRVADDIGYIKLSSFTQGAGDEVAKALSDLEAEGQLKGIVLDLKGNGGGLLVEAINVANVFVDKGQEVVTIKTKNNQNDKTYKTRNKAIDTQTPLVVLIDGGTASASEIVSGTIQDLDRGVVIGRNSFGKGLVQSTRDLSFNSKLKLTTAKYLIPSGRCVQRINYNEKDADGKPIEMPDSLKKAFKTANGRTVYDGTGIMPDVEVAIETFPEIAFALFRENYIYDYSLDYKMKHPTIAPAADFKLSDAEYNEFKKFLADKHYEYQTDSEKELEQFKKAVSEEKHDAAFDKTLQALEANLKASKQNDLDKYKEEIKYLLEREIASRYYYTAGRIENGLDDDRELKEAIVILDHPVQYSEILNP